MAKETENENDNLPPPDTDSARALFVPFHPCRGGAFFIMSDSIHRSPAFQFYADDFLAGTLDLSQEEVGAYIRLLCHQWNRGSIPVETEKQQRLAGGSVSVDVLAKFRKVDGSGFVNERLERERAKQAEFRQMQREKGLLSAKARRNQPRFNHGSTAVGTASQPDGQPNTQPEGNSPASSFQPPNSILPGKPSGGQPPKERKPIARNETLDALVASCGGDPLATTRSAWAQAATALRDIREVTPNVTPDEIKTKAATYRRLHRDWDLTPMALAKHWGSLTERKSDLFDGEDWRQCL